MTDPITDKQMASNSTKPCRLCLQTTAVDLVNVWEQFQGTTIASILIKHFWFHVEKNDGMPQWLCDVCWNQTKTFHNFYKTLELVHSKYEPSVAVGCDSIKKENDDGVIDTILQPGTIVIKGETVDANQMLDDNSSWIENICQKNYTEVSHAFVDDVDYDDDGNGNGNNKKRRPKKKSGNSSTPSDNIDAEKKMAKIHEYFNMKCEFCSDVEFKSWLIARQHYAKVHNTDGYLVCCGRKFHKRCRILEHIDYHLNPEAMRCNKCSRVFRDKKSFKQHMNNHQVPSDSREFKCGLCASSFTKSWMLKTHVKNKHSGQTFSCDRCGKDFNSNLSLKNHISLVHEYSLEHVCEICARQFKTKQNLKEHIEYNHPAEALPKAQCNICNVWLKNKRGLVKHLQRHQGTNPAFVEDPINCTVCDKTMRNKSALKRHMRKVHDKRFKCTLCEKQFSIALHLKEHMAWHTGEYLYDCLYCSRKFKSNANMYSHRKKAHPEEWTRDFPQPSLLTTPPTKEKIEAELLIALSKN